MKNVRASIDDESLEYAVSGATCAGEALVLLSQDDDLIKDRPWADAGYRVDRYLSPELYAQTILGVRTLLLALLRAHVPVDESLFRLEDYHHFVNDEIHLRMIEASREGFLRERFPFDLRILEDRISELCGFRVAADCPTLKQMPFNVRIVRPGLRKDHNPPHRDVWLKHLRDAVNIYVPIAGSDGKSSLPVLPGSHLWKESEIERTVDGAIVDGTAYRVPAVTSCKSGIAMTRPNPGPNEMLIFSPYLIHGGAVNRNLDTTRVSLEMRFWRA